MKSTASKLVAAARLLKATNLAGKGCYATCAPG